MCGREERMRKEKKPARLQAHTSSELATLQDPGGSKLWGGLCARQLTARDHGGHKARPTGSARPTVRADFRGRLFFGF
jgi:hypothetical protein